MKFLMPKTLRDMRHPLSKVFVFFMVLVCSSVLASKPASAFGICELLGAIGFFTKGDPEHTCVTAVNGWADKATQYVKTKVDVKLAQMQTDGIKIYGGQIAQANITEKSYFAGDVSAACAVSQAHQNRAVMGEGAEKAAQAFQTIAAQQNTSDKANAGAPRDISESLCEVREFICDNGRYGRDLPNKLQSCDNSFGPSCPLKEFADADINPESLLSKRQFIMPPNIGRMDDGHVNIKATTPDELSFKAAWKVCQNMALGMPTPPHTAGALNVQLIQQIVDDRSMALLRKGSTSMCWEVLAQRLAYPANTNIPFGAGANNNAHDVQVAACNRLKANVPLGMNLKQLPQDMQYALDHCETNGLSAEMFDYIYSHRCMDDGYVTQTGVVDAQGDTLEALKGMRTCQEDIMAYDHHFEYVQFEFKKALRDIAQMRGGSISSQDNTSQTVR
jgi:hypothetical protein